MKRSWILLAPLATLALSWGLSTGCATDGVVDAEDSSAEPIEASSDTGSDSTLIRDSSRDTSVPDTSRPDTSVEAAVPDAADADASDAGPLVSLPGEEFDPTAPKPGDPCPTGIAENDVVPRRCGKCGTQKAFCETGRKVGGYGPCLAEKTGVDSCLPREREVGLECGLCGSRVRVCDNACVWSSGLCLNEVAGGCVAREVRYVEGVCANVDEVRRQTCSATCTRGAPEPCAPQLPDVITASQTRDGKVSADFSLTDTRTIPRLNAGSCPATSSTVGVTYHFARIVNSGADSINVTVNQLAPSTGTKPNTYISAYVGRTTEPITAAERQACTDSVRDSPESITVNIPAGQSAIVLSTAALVSTTGKFKLEVVTNFIGAEPPPAVDTDVVMDPVMGQTVTAPVSFVPTQVLERVNTGVCPRTVTTTRPAYRYIRLSNATGTDRTVNVWLANGLDTVIGAYPGPTPPLSTDRGACIGEINDFCSGNAAANSCLNGLTVPAGGSIIVYASGYSLTTGATTFSALTTN